MYQLSDLRELDSAMGIVGNWDSGIQDTTLYQNNADISNSLLKTQTQAE